MNMKIRPQLLQPTKSYANHTPPLKAGMLDCSLGVNPYGCRRRRWRLCSSLTGRGCPIIPTTTA